MKKRKILVSLIVLAALAAIIGFSLRAGRQTLTSVETGTVERRGELVAIVSATGEIKPREYVELQAEITGVITELFVREGDFVERGSLLLRIDPMQTLTEARAQEALLASARAEARNQFAQISVQESNVDRDLAGVRVAEAELERARQSFQLSQATFDRRQQLFEDNLIPRDTYEAARNDLVASEAALSTAAVRLDQARAQYRASQVVLEQARLGYESSMSRVAQQEAFLDRSRDLLSKTELRSPLAGVITQLNVEVGERAVPGTLNNPAATLMIIANLSVIEAELQVGETDIVDVKLGQPAVIKVDALPNRPLKGTVTEIGNSAIQKLGQQQEARDFKVVVQLEDPPDALRPGLSCTGEITTAVRRDTLAIPIQALTIREFEVDEEGRIVRAEESTSAAKASAPGSGTSAERMEIEGAFRVVDGKAIFTPVDTGIIGEALMEILSGLGEGDTIVTGSYRTLRTLADGDPVKIERRERG
jgi:HlyD family secretion protein